eukprot:6460378-Pyramimonas_sp.AAC.2
MGLIRQLPEVIARGVGVVGLERGSVHAASPPPWRAPRFTCGACFKSHAMPVVFASRGTVIGLSWVVCGQSCVPVGSYCGSLGALLGHFGALSGPKGALEAP